MAVPQTWRRSRGSRLVKRSTPRSAVLPGDMLAVFGLPIGQETTHVASKAATYRTGQGDALGGEAFCAAALCWGGFALAYLSKVHE
jgi:hypothetical protein